jgi:hypothetical protein
MVLIAIIIVNYHSQKPRESKSYNKQTSPYILAIIITNTTAIIAALNHSKTLRISSRIRKLTTRTRDN